MNKFIATAFFVGIFFHANMANAGWEAVIRAEGQKIDGLYISEVVIGVGTFSETISAPPPPPAYSCYMAIQSPEGKVLFKDIRKTGEADYCWVFQMKFPMPAYQSGTLSWNPSNFGKGSFVLRKGDDCAGEIIIGDMNHATSVEITGQNFTITWQPQNTEPTITGTPDSEAQAGKEYAFIPKAFDPDEDDALTFNIVNKPTWANFDMATGRLFGTPGTEDVGTYAGISVHVTDTRGGVASLPPFDITVIAGDDPTDPTDDSGDQTTDSEDGADTDGEDEVKNSAPGIPTPYFPADGDECESTAPEFMAGEFADPDGDTHDKSQWQISAVPDFSSPVFDETTSEHLTSLKITDHVLAQEADYYWRVRYFDDKGNASDWSASYEFHTSSAEDTNCDGIPDGQEVDDAEDLDRSGETDNYQADIKSIRSVVGDVQIGLKMLTNVKTIASLRSVHPNEIVNSTNRPDQLPYGLIDFKLAVKNPGDQAEVAVYFSTALPEDMGWHKYDTQTGWRDYSAHTIFADDRRSVVLTLQDGGFGDSDRIANGVIVDPSGPGRMDPVPEPETASDDSDKGGGGNGCFIGASHN